MTDISQVRFRAYYPDWPRAAASSGLDSFQPTTAWRQLALCTPPQGRRHVAGTGCRWNGNRRDAVVSFDWDPTLAPPRTDGALAASSPAGHDAGLHRVRARVAGRGGRGRGRPRLLADRSPARAGRLRRARRRRAAGTRRVLYLDPLVPPEAPAPQGHGRATAAGRPSTLPTRSMAPSSGGPLGQRGRLPRLRAAQLVRGRLLGHRTAPGSSSKELPPDTKRYRPQHTKVVALHRRPGDQGRAWLHGPLGVRRHGLQRGRGDEARCRSAASSAARRRSATRAWSRPLTSSQHSPFGRSARRGGATTDRRRAAPRTAADGVTAAERRRWHG